MSISKAQLDAINSGVLKSLGKDANDPDLKSGSLLDDLLTGVAQKLTDELRKAITDKGAVASKNLRSSVDLTQTVKIANGVKCDIVMADYWEFVDQGRGKTKRGNQGGKFLWQSIEEWITAKGIQVRQSKEESGQSVLERRKSMAVAIANKIHRKGFKGKFFVKDVLNPQNIDAIAQHLSDAFGQRIILSVKIEEGKTA